MVNFCFKGPCTWGTDCVYTKLKSHRVKVVILCATVGRLVLMTSLVTWYCSQSRDHRKQLYTLAETDKRSLYADTTHQSRQHQSTMLGREFTNENTAKHRLYRILRYLQ